MAEPEKRMRPRADLASDVAELLDRLAPLYALGGELAPLRALGMRLPIEPLETSVSLHPGVCLWRGAPSTAWPRRPAPARRDTVEELVTG